MTDVSLNSWRGVRAELLRRINEREWTPGMAVPNEAQLSEEFGCARSTVNRAMRDLAEAGLLDRRRRAGTRVSAQPTSRFVLDIPIIQLEVEQRNARYRYALIDEQIGIPPVSVSGRLGLGAQTQMRHVRGLHFADDRPFLLEDRWINIGAVPGAASADFTAVSSNEWLIQNAPYTSGDIAFTAINSEPWVAEHLGVAPGTAVFTVDRVTWDAEVPITSVTLSYAPGYRMNSRI